jgi:DNA-binding MarR family transcriptional regulator
MNVRPDDGTKTKMDLPRLRLDDQLCFALYAATHAVTRAYRPLLAPLGLTYPQYLVMLVLWQDGACSPSAVAKRLRLGRNAITPLVEQLVAAGLVARGASGTDRRLVTLALTDEGHRLHEAAAAAQEKVVCATGLTPPALVELRDTLQDLVMRMSVGVAGGAIGTANGADLSPGDADPAAPR